MMGATCAREQAADPSSGQAQPEVQTTELCAPRPWMFVLTLAVRSQLKEQQATMDGQDVDRIAELSSQLQSTKLQHDQLQQAKDSLESKAAADRDEIQRLGQSLAEAEA